MTFVSCKKKYINISAVFLQRMQQDDTDADTDADADADTRHSTDEDVVQQKPRLLGSTDGSNDDNDNNENVIATTRSGRCTTVRTRKNHNEGTPLMN